MALTLSRVMARTWRELGMSVNIKATGGSTTTVVDTATKYTTDDSLIGGTALVTYDANGASAAPEGEFSRISDFVASTWTFTIDAVTAAIAAGDRVDLVRPTITWPQMMEAVNDGIRDLGYIQLVDTSITLTSGQSEYTLPVTVKRADLVDVLIQTYDDANDNQWVSIMHGCKLHPAAPGSTGLIIVDQEILDNYVNYDVKMIYNGEHPLLTAHNSVISEFIPERLAVAAAVDKALTWLVSKRGESALNTFLSQRWADAKMTIANVRQEIPIFRPAKQAARWFASLDTEDTSTPGTVSLS